MKIAATLLIFLTLATGSLVSAQRTRRGARQPATKAGPTTPTPTPVVENAPAAPKPSAPVAPVLLAVVNGQEITTASLEPSVREEVESLPGRISEAKRSVLEMEINTLLLESEAVRRRLNSQQLYDAEVAKKLGKPTAALIDKFISENRERITEPDSPSAREDVADYLIGEREAALSKALVTRLRQTHKVTSGVDIDTPNLAPTAVLATVDGRAITYGSISERLKPIIYRLRLNAYLTQKPALDLTINDILLLAEANRQNVGPEAIVRSQVSDKVKAPTEAEVAKFYEDNKSKITGTLDSLRNQIATYLQEQNRRKLEEDLSARLRRGANIRIMLTEPERPVQMISVDDDPSRGSATAPVTVVVFTDFQCPTCAVTHPIIDDVLKPYGNNVRLVVRDFPLNMHVNARKAAEAANAAHAQGKFFEYAALLFQRQKALDTPSLKKYASELGLNRATFDAALDSGKYAAEVSRDLKDGEIYGIEGTPTIFVNGVALASLRAEDIRAAIDRALAASKSPKASTQ
ncbi:MAG TPA: thioredoxin domain-containing protein [Pyrinomonadaceae bacterium]